MTSEIINAKLNSIISKNTILRMPKFPSIFSTASNAGANLSRNLLLGVISASGAIYALGLIAPMTGHIYRTGLEHGAPYLKYTGIAQWIMKEFYSSLITVLKVCGFIISLFIPHRRDLKNAISLLPQIAQTLTTLQKHLAHESMVAKSYFWIRGLPSRYETIAKIVNALRDRSLKGWGVIRSFIIVTVGTGVLSMISAIFVYLRDYSKLSSLRSQIISKKALTPVALPTQDPITTLLTNLLSGDYTTHSTELSYDEYLATIIEMAATLFIKVLGAGSASRPIIDEFSETNTSSKQLRAQGEGDLRILDLSSFSNKEDRENILKHLVILTRNKPLPGPLGFLLLNLYAKMLENFMNPISALASRLLVKSQVLVRPLMNIWLHTWIGFFRLVFELNSSLGPNLTYPLVTIAILASLVAIAAICIRFDKQVSGAMFLIAVVMLPLTLAKSVLCIEWVLHRGHRSVSDIFGLELIAGVYKSKILNNVIVKNPYADNINGPGSLESITGMSSVAGNFWYSKKPGIKNGQGAAIRRNVYKNTYTETIRLAELMAAISEVHKDLISEALGVKSENVVPSGDLKDLIPLGGQEMARYVQIFKSSDKYADLLEYSAISKTASPLDIYRSLFKDKICNLQFIEAVNTFGITPMVIHIFINEEDVSKLNTYEIARRIAVAQPQDLHNTEISKEIVGSEVPFYIYDLCKEPSLDIIPPNRRIIYNITQRVMQRAISSEIVENYSVYALLGPAGIGKSQAGYNLSALLMANGLETVMFKATLSTFMQAGMSKEEIADMVDKYFQDILLQARAGKSVALIMDEIATMLSIRDFEGNETSKYVVEALLTTMDKVRQEMDQIKASGSQGNLTIICTGNCAVSHLDNSFLSRAKNSGDIYEIPPPGHYEFFMGLFNKLSVSEVTINNDQDQIMSEAELRSWILGLEGEGAYDFRLINSIIGAIRMKNTFVSNQMRARDAHVEMARHVNDPIVIKWKALLEIIEQQQSAYTKSIRAKSEGVIKLTPLKQKRKENYSIKIPEIFKSYGLREFSNEQKDALLKVGGKGFTERFADLGQKLGNLTKDVGFVDQMNLQRRFRGLKSVGGTIEPSRIKPGEDLERFTDMVFDYLTFKPMALDTLYSFMVNLYAMPAVTEVSNAASASDQRPRQERT